jgi:anti-sigma factor RsiW
MTCEEFEAIGLDADRDASLSEAEHAAAVEHAASCSHCAALQNSWQAARLELHSLAEETAGAQAPPRVEMRLRQEFRTQHHTVKARRTALIAAWALTAAAVLIGAVSWITWHKSRTENAAGLQLPSPSPQSASVPSAIKPDGIAPSSETPVRNGQARGRAEAVKNAGTEALVADNGWSGFTLLPGVLPVDTDYGEILHVRMQRGALESFGLPVNEERAGEWIQVDLLVGNDGLPEAVRLSR